MVIPIYVRPERIKEADGKGILVEDFSVFGPEIPYSKWGTSPKQNSTEHRHSNYGPSVSCYQPANQPGRAHDADDVEINLFLDCSASVESVVISPFRLPFRLSAIACSPPAERIANANRICPR
tara:strand:- start:42 stop:410 length:369 start_codon:yes stop_codon:yes gene_type:complete